MKDNQNVESKNNGVNTESKPDGAKDKSAQSLNSPSRRKFLGKLGGIAAATVAVNAVDLPSMLDTKGGGAEARLIGPLNPQQRRAEAFNVRLSAANQQKNKPLPNHPCNGDEDLYPTRIGSYTKGLRHNSIGEVIPSAYNAYLSALASGRFNRIEALSTNGHLGCDNPDQQRRFVNPLAGDAFDLEGADSHALTMRAAPAFASAEEAGEMAEMYWMATLRDVSFNSYSGNLIAEAAANDLSNFSDFRGPKDGGVVTTQTLFRDNFPGCTVGPYISQFLLKDAPFGAQLVDQKVAGNTPNINFMTNFQDWLDVQNGCQPTQSITPAGARFIVDGRDLSQYVHIDALYQAYFVACLILLGNGIPWNIGNPYGQTPEPGSGRPLPVGVPGALAQVGFGTFGGPYILALLTEVSTRALKAVWYQKWFVHRRLRPEEFGGRVENIRLGNRTLADYPIHSDLFDSDILDAVMNGIGGFGGTGNYLLPMAFPEGSPMHTAYGSGHATVAGACTTILKAFFDESAIVPNPVVPAADGLSTVPFVGPPLTVGGELNKVASNVAQGRDIAGVHWRTDATESIKLGEAVAISVLKDQRRTYSEPFDGYTFTKFDGTTITV